MIISISDISRINKKTFKRNIDFINKDLDYLKKMLQANLQQIEAIESSTKSWIRTLGEQDIGAMKSMVDNLSYGIEDCEKSSKTIDWLYKNYGV